MKILSLIIGSIIGTFLLTGACYWKININKVQPELEDSKKGAKAIPVIIETTNDLEGGEWIFVESIYESNWHY